MLAIQIQNPASQIIIPTPTTTETQWHEVFDRREALLAVQDHIKGLPSSSTPEKYTKKVYEAGIEFFLVWGGNELPTRQLVKAYVGELLQGIQKDGTYGDPRQASTVSSKYLAPLRRYLEELSDQIVKPMGTADRELIEEWRRHIIQASKVKNPPPSTNTAHAPLWSEGIRLDHAQVNSVLRRIDDEKLAGLRDEALLHIAFVSGLRVAELARITLNTITVDGTKYLITVRGKRNNVTPVPVGKMGIDKLMAYIDEFNSRLEAGDPRRIVGDIPVWQPITKGDTLSPLGSYDPKRGISRNSISRVIGKRSEPIVGNGRGLAAHDTRRTAAALAYEAGRTPKQIQKLLRHKDESVTRMYIGEKPDYDDYMLENFVQIG